MRIRIGFMFEIVMGCEGTKDKCISIIILSY